MGYITNHSFNLKFSIQALGTPANPNFKIVWSRFSSDKEGVQYNSVGLYLQRSYSKTNAPGQVGATPAAPRVVVSTTPTVEAGWTTIKSWSAAETAALPDGTIVRYQDNSSQVNPPSQNQTLYAYRLIYYAEESGSNYEIDYRPASATGGTGGAPGSVVWATSMGGTGTDYGNAVTTDTLGNSYTTGVFSGTAHFGSFTLTSSGGYNCFLAKYNSSGACLFAVNVGAIISSAPAGIALDTLDGSGNIYIGGGFAAGFLVKLNAAGVVQWTHGPVATGLQNVSVYAIASDASGNVTVTGSFVAGYLTPLDFGNSHPMTSVSGSTDAFLAQYSNTGACLWATNFQNYGDSEFGTGLAVDRANSNNIFLAGYSVSGMLINGIPLSNTPGSSGTCGYLAKFTSGGNLIGSLARNVGVNGGNQGYSRVNCIALDSDGNVFLGGAFNYHCDFGGGDRFLIGTAQQASFVVKYNGSTLAWMWDAEVSPSFYTNIQSIAVDSSRNVFATGSFTRQCTFGSTVMTSLSDQNTTSDAFVMRISSVGVILWAKQFGGTDGDLGNGIAIDATGQVVATGTFANNVNGTAAPWGSGSLTSHGSVDGFLTAVRA